VVVSHIVTDESFLEDASEDIGRVLDGTKDYAIVISVNPEPEFLCYGLRNKSTLVDEYLTSSLAKARWVIKEIQKDLDEGYDRHAREAENPPPGATSKVVPWSPGKAN
jgi:hypothetical protein